MENKQSILITGAARGIGFGLAEYYAKQGSKVMIADVDGNGAKKAAAALVNKGYEAVGAEVDVTSEDDIKFAFREILDHYGRLDVLINNAGMQYVSPIEDFPTEQFEKIVKIMLTATFMTLKQALPIMREQKYGRIINMASVNGLIGFAGKSAYNSAKHGVIGLSKVAALETAQDGITVNSVAPGYVDTPLLRNQLQDLAKSRNTTEERALEEIIYPLVPQNRLISIDEVASVCYFLSYHSSQGITGQTYVVDGGYIAQ